MIDDIPRTTQLEAVRAQRDRLMPLVQVALDYAAGGTPVSAEDRARGDTLVLTAHKASLTMAEIFLKLGDLDAAGELLRKALDLAIEVGMLNIRLGVQHVRNGDFLAAIFHFSHAEALEAGVAQQALQLGRALSRARRRGDAAEALETYLALGPGSLVAITELAQCHLFEGQATRARELSERAVRMDPENYIANLRLGQANHALGDRRSAREAYLRALRIQPASVEAARLLDILEDANP